MRFNFRVKIKNITIFFMIAQTQTMEGFTSLIKNVKNVKKNQHILMWDLEGCNIYQAINTLKEVQHKYNLGEIFITGENVWSDSFRGWCFTLKPFDEYLKILLDSKHIDYFFFKYTVRRGKATLRISNKKNRPPQSILWIIEGKPEPIPRRMEKVIYDTGLIKHGKTLNFERC